MAVPVFVDSKEGIAVPVELPVTEVVPVCEVEYDICGLELSITELDPIGVFVGVGSCDIVVVPELKGLADAPVLSVPATEIIGDTDGILVIDSSGVPVTSNDIVGMIVDVINDDSDDMIEHDEAGELDTDTLLERLIDSPADDVLLTIGEEEAVNNILIVGECDPVLEFVEEELIEDDNVPVLLPLVLPVCVIDMVEVFEPVELSVEAGVLVRDTDDDMDALPLEDSDAIAVNDSCGVADSLAVIDELPHIDGVPESL